MLEFITEIQDLAKAYNPFEELKDKVRAEAGKGRWFISFTEAECPPKCQKAFRDAGFKVSRFSYSGNLVNAGSVTINVAWQKEKTE